MKLLIVRSSQPSTWGSCKVISPNLQQTYHLLEKDFTIEWFDVPVRYQEHEVEGTSDAIHSLAQKISNTKPDQLIFIDHLPNPADLLCKLSLVLEPRKIPPVSIHVYGDFTYFSKDWLELSTRLPHHPIRLIAASASQKQLIEYFCEENKGVTSFHFPVKTTDYQFDAAARKEIRQQLKIADSDIVLIYAGRVSLQKNVDLLLMEYLELLRQEETPVHLWIAGAFDDLGAPFMGLETAEGYLFSKIQTILSQHPKQFTKNIKLWGHLEKAQLKRVMSAADAFVSLSLYHDEDFGMSPAEALSNGLPALLTDWGGYSSFTSSKWRCKLAPVKITEYGLQIKTSAVKNFVQQLKQTYAGTQDRERWGSEFAAKFSIESSAAHLKSILAENIQPFAGFNWALAPFAQLYSKQHRSKTIDPNTCPSSKNFYAQVYENYISQEDFSKEHFKVVNWAYDYIVHSQQNAAMPVGKKIRPNHFYLQPFSNDYTGPHSPVLLGGYITKKLQNKKLFSLRDGLIPLSFFFREHSPEPGIEYALSSDFWYVVPDHWRAHVLFFDINSTETYPEKTIERILIAGMQDSTFAELDEMHKLCEDIKKIVPADKRSSFKVSALLPFKKNNLWGKKTELNSPAAIQELLSLFPQTQFCEWRNLKDESDFKNTLYIELNKKYFIADSSLLHFALSRGAILPKNEIPRDCSLIQNHLLSCYHSVSLYRPDWEKFPSYTDPFSQSYFHYFQELCRGQLKSIRISPQWESWYPLYLKKFYSLYPPVSR